MSVESFNRPSQEEENKSDAQKELAAEQELQSLLDDPDNAFLTKVTANHEVIENSPSAVEALAYARTKIEERLNRTANFQTFKSIEGVSLIEVDLHALKHTMDTILANQQEIGRGGDGFVVIDRNEIRNFPPEICYKFALTETTPLGRNSVPSEAEIQGLFFDVAETHSESKIGVPLPFYALEIGSRKMIAMEKLNAKSLQDILEGNGFVPQWFNVDRFCDELTKMIDYCHQAGLYHRDMHFGNVMLSQKEELSEGDKWGYIIDFGRSGRGEEDDSAYQKEIAGQTFTYLNDYGIISEVKKQLRKLQNSNREL